MIIRPIYNILLLPDVTYYFKADFFSESAGGQLEAGTDIIFAFVKEDIGDSSLQPGDFYPIGLSARIENIGEDDAVQVRTLHRVVLTDITVDQDEVRASVSLRPDIEDMTEEQQKEEFSRLRGSLLKFVQGYQWGLWARGFILQRKTMSDLASSLSDYLNLTAEEKYAILACDSVQNRYRLIEKAVQEFMEVAKVAAEAQDAQKNNQEQLYREAALKKQIDYLQKELDDMHPENISDVRKFEKKIEASGMNEEARKEAEKVLNRMRQEGKESHEYGLLYDYLDFVTSLSWKAPKFEAIDLTRAEEVLDEDHYGLKKVKKRIIQQLAVMALNKKQYGSILLFAGAPGTGKTSIGQSIARALGREYVRISLGGIRDEAEIRGHRRTYIGAMPGRIMNAMKQVGTINPLMLLDEVDKLGVSYNGDPAAALLEVLDGEQNFTFRDHYVEMPYDLSKVLFMCTANSLEPIPGPLRDRMEIIELGSYTATEKQHIAMEHLVKKQMKRHGLKGSQLKIRPEAVEMIIDGYTREAGVRQLERTIGQVCRKAVKAIISGEKKSMTVTAKNLEEILGKPRFTEDRIYEEPQVGIVRGLAWTAVGGTTLSVEVNTMPGNGKFRLTGNLGKVMKESAEAAISYIRSQSDRFKVEPDFYKKQDLHIHIPEGATPKDGPSAGVTMTTAMLSALTGAKVRNDVAMTGEVTIRGRVLAIGGLREKVLAAKKAGVKTVILPKQNEKDLQEISDEIKEGLEFVLAKEMDDVLKHALAKGESVWK